MQKVIQSEKVTHPMFCWRCGRIIYEDIRNGHTGCRNTKCRGYLWGSKNLSDNLLRQVIR